MGYIRTAGKATLQHVNIRKTGEDDDELVADLKLKADDVDADIIRYLLQGETVSNAAGDKLEHHDPVAVLYDDEKRLKLTTLPDLTFDDPEYFVFDQHRFRLGPYQWESVTAKKFRVKLRDQGRADIVFSVAVPFESEEQCGHTCGKLKDESDFRLEPNDHCDLFASDEQRFRSTDMAAQEAVKAIERIRDREVLEYTIEADTRVSVRNAATVRIREIQEAEGME